MTAAKPKRKRYRKLQRTENRRAARVLQDGISRPLPILAGKRGELTMALENYEAPIEELPTSRNRNSAAAQ
eukprot:s681_g1.t1